MPAGETTISLQIDASRKRIRWAWRFPRWRMTWRLDVLIVWTCIVAAVVRVFGELFDLLQAVLIFWVGWPQAFVPYVVGAAVIVSCGAAYLTIAWFLRERPRGRLCLFVAAVAATCTSPWLIIGFVNAGQIGKTRVEFQGNKYEFVFCTQDDILYLYYRTYRLPGSSNSPREVAGFGTFAVADPADVVIINGKHRTCYVDKQYWCDAHFVVDHEACAVYAVVGGASKRYDLVKGEWHEMVVPP